MPCDQLMGPVWSVDPHWQQWMQFRGFFQGDPSAPGGLHQLPAPGHGWLHQLPAPCAEPWAEERGRPLNAEEREALALWRADQQAVVAIWGLNPLSTQEDLKKDLAFIDYYPKNIVDCGRGAFAFELDTQYQARGMVVALHNHPDVASVLKRCGAGIPTREEKKIAKAKEIDEEFEESVRLAHWTADDPDAEEIPDDILKVLCHETWAPVLSDTILRELRLERYGDVDQLDVGPRSATARQAGGKQAAQACGDTSRKPVHSSRNPRIRDLVLLDA